MNPGKPHGGSLNSISRPHSKRELAELLGVSVHILKQMIAEVQEELGEPHGGLYCVNQVEFMVKKYGAVR